MNSSSLRCLAVSLSLALYVPLLATAQDKVKPPRRLPPNASETSRIPAGVDTGSPVTGDSLPLGTPVPPNASAGRTELTTRSAAARAAARPKLASSSGACTKKLGPAAGDAGKPTVRLSGNPAGPATGASASMSRIDC